MYNVYIILYTYTYMYYTGLTVRGNILGIKSGQSDHQVSASLDRSWSSYKHTQIGDCCYIVIQCNGVARKLAVSD